MYKVYDFDGYHIDQVGNRDKNLYKFDGSLVDVSQTFEPFIHSMKTFDSSRLLVMNAVNQYGQQGIARTNVEFMYTEVWPPNEQYDGLANVILDNDKWSNNEKRTVLTAYVHFVEGRKQEGFYNEAAVLLADAVIFSFGGSHLELGEHMLGAPYFPEDLLSMREGLKTAILHYYDFLVAYQNILRDGGVFNYPKLRSVNNSVPLNNWPAKKGSIAVMGKEWNDKQVIHLLNFKDAPTLEWRDTRHIQQIPKTLTNLQLSLASARQVKNIWYASPDWFKASARKIAFRQNGDGVDFIVPVLKYWDMIVVEYQ